MINFDLMRSDESKTFVNEDRNKEIGRFTMGVENVSSPKKEKKLGDLLGSASYVPKYDVDKQQWEKLRTSEYYNNKDPGKSTSSNFNPKRNSLYYDASGSQSSMM
jgi:hypothetical protein